MHGLHRLLIGGWEKRIVQLAVDIVRRRKFTAAEYLMQLGS